MILEKILYEAKKLSWDGNPKIGWWKDQDPLRLYHGTHKDNVDAISAEGFRTSTGWISFALEPNTAIGYASMAGEGGEIDFRRKTTPRTVAMEDRRVFVLDVPLAFVLRNMDEKLGGNTRDVIQNLQDKNKYETFSGKDHVYYRFTEIRLKSVPRQYITGVMAK